MPPLRLTNHNALAARLIAFTLFGIPSALGFFYGTYLWFQEGGDASDLASLKELGMPLLGLGIALVFAYLAATTDWSVTLDSEGLRVRTLTTSRSYVWPELREVALQTRKTKVVLVGEIGPTVNKTLNLVFLFDVAGQQFTHEVLIRKTDVGQLIRQLQMVGREDLLQ